MENYSISLAESGIYTLIFNTIERWVEYHRYSNTVYDIGSSTYFEIEEFLPDNVKYVVTDVQDKDQIVFYFIPRDLVMKRREVLFTSSSIKKQVCEHKNEVMRQGEGFVYVTCKDCGEEI